MATQKQNFKTKCKNRLTIGYYKSMKFFLRTCHHSSKRKEWIKKNLLKLSKKIEKIEY